MDCRDTVIGGEGCGVGKEILWGRGGSGDKGEDGEEETGWEMHLGIREGKESVSDARAQRWIRYISRYSDGGERGT